MKMKANSKKVFGIEQTDTPSNKKWLAGCLILNNCLLNSFIPFLKISM